MKRAYWIGLVPSLLLAVGVVASTAVAVLAAESGWFVLAGPLVMALAVVGASILGYQLYGDSRDTFRGALILGAALLLAGAIVTLRDPSLVAMLMPVLGGGAAAFVVLNMDKRIKGRRSACVGRLRSWLAGS